jgi:DNA-binding response OmpR family regulator
MGNKVLIVDDDPDIVTTLKFSLELEGIRTVEAYDGEEALAAVEREDPDLILLDGMLPHVNGYMIARRLKGEGRLREVPIIMVTARAQQDDMVLGRETGVDEYVTKPFDMGELVALVKRYLKTAAA